jgi:hypothetical protein
MQSSRALLALPVAAVLAVSSLCAQARYRVALDGEGVFQSPGETRLGRVARGATVLAAGATQGEWVQIVIDGWIFARSVGPASRPGFDLAVTREPDENVRATPNGALVARFVRGTQLMRVAAESNWVRVRREVWVPRAALEPIAAVVSVRTSADTTPTRDTAAAPVDPALARAARPTPLFRAPDGPEGGTVGAATPVRVLGRSGEWTRVQIEGWVRTADLETAPPGVLVGVTAAEVRAEPARYRGQVLRWHLQFIALQTADDLRPDIPAGMAYLLARGPLPERGFVYVVLDDAQRAAAARLTPLATVQVTARVRQGRSRFLGHPVVDLLSLEALP